MNSRKLYDRLAGFFIMLGGVSIIAGILAVFGFILIEVMPLFSSPSHGPSKKSVESPVFAGALGIGLDEHRQTAYAVFRRGDIRVFSTQTGAVLKTVSSGAPALSFARAPGARAFAIGGADGKARIFSVSHEDIYSDGGAQREVLTTIEPSAEIPVASSGLEIVSFARGGEGAYSLAALSVDGGLFLVSLSGSVEDESLFADEEQFPDQSSLEVFVSDITGDARGEKITALAFLEEASFLYAGTDSGRILRWDSSGPGAPVFLGSTETGGAPVTMMGVIHGGRSVAIGDSEGNLSVWFRPVGNPGIERVHSFPKFEGAVERFSNSLRNRGFTAADSLGNIGVFHATTAKRRLLIKGSPVSALVMTPKADGIAAVEDGALVQWDISNDFSEISLRSIFSRVWYEGYDSPIHMWQSTGGTDEFEPKLGLAPIIFGTFKGAIYSLLFAVPLAVLAALCVSQFMHPSFGKVIKPVIEIMAGLPSVVIGFFAGLWLSPILEKIFPALVVMPFVTFGLALFSLYLWKKFGKSLAGSFRHGTEYLLLIPVLAAAAAVSLWLNSPAEAFLFQGDYKQWLAAIGLDFDQRNALVVGFAMGFAVIPIVFTIAEDSMSGVPKSLVAASLALGASRWQTATRVVMPSASPGILSAVVIGFGRAVGETMIVLMATGNTPLLDWNIFNGFRAMSANIAVELPEAPHGGGLYRLIFFTSLLLFLFTFCLNTVAEIFRGKLERKYGSS
ncbi:ABC transporter permease subunit [Candidatus Mycalebacterium sp.]